MEPVTCPRCGREQPETSQSDECLFCGETLTLDTAEAETPEAAPRAPLPPPLDAFSPEIEETESASGSVLTDDPPATDPVGPTAGAPSRRTQAQVIVAIVVLGFVANLAISQFTARHRRSAAPPKSAPVRSPLWPITSRPTAMPAPVRSSGG